MATLANPSLSGVPESFVLAHDSRIGARLVNQDRLAHWRTSRALLLVLADGLGGHLHGEVAAQVAVAYFGAAFRAAAQPEVADPARFLAHSMAHAHAALVQTAQRLGLPETPRTVLVACLVQDGQAHWSHIGDCRMYLLRKPRIALLTRDHSVVQQLLDAGAIDESQAADHPERHRLLRCLGSEETPRPEPAQKLRLASRDIVLLCSDGFWSSLTRVQLGQALFAQPLQVAVRELATLAERRGGTQCDNVSVLAMSWSP